MIFKLLTIYKKEGTIGIIKRLYYKTTFTLKKHFYVLKHRNAQYTKILI